MSAKDQYRIIDSGSYADGEPMYELQEWVPGWFVGGRWRYAGEFGRFDQMKRSLDRKANPHIVYASDANPNHKDRR